MNPGPAPPAASGHRIGWREIQSYGTADFGQIAMVQLTSIYLLFFLTDIAHLDAATVGTIFFVSRLWDAVNDPIMGWIIDRTHTRFGRCRPYFIPGSILLVLATWALFSSPGLDGVLLLVYVAVTYNIFNMAFTAVNLPITAQLPLLTDHSGDRIRLSAARAFFESLAYAFLPLVAEFALSRLGGRLEASAYQWLVAGLGIICVLAFTDAFFRTRERVYLKPEKMDLAALRLVFAGQSTWLIILLVNVLLSTALIIRTTAAIYYFRDVHGSMQGFAWFMALSTLAMIPMSLLATALGGRWGKRRFSQFGCVLGIVGNLLILLFPENTAMLLLGGMLGGCAIGAFVSVLFAMEGDIADRVDAQTGVRAQGMICAAIALGYKIALGLGGALVGWLLGSADYDPTLAVQSAAVKHAITIAFVWVPLICAGVSLVLLEFYRLDLELPGIRKALLERNPTPERA